MNSNILNDFEETHSLKKKKTSPKRKSKSKKSTSEKESSIQMRLLKYLKEKHPHLVIKCDMSGIRLSIGAAVKLKKLGMLSSSFPDLQIFKQIKNYGGFFLELKREGKLKKKNGDWKSTHLEEQAETILKLQKEGYYATFGVGFDESLVIIKAYLEGRPMISFLDLQNFQ